MKPINTLLLLPLLLFSNGVFSQLSSVITCWQQNTTNLGFANELTNVQEVNYSDTYVYVKTEDIPSWIPVGYNWPNNPWFAEAMGYQFRIRRNPIPNVGPITYTGYGHIGLWKNGCSIYNPKDAKHYQDSLTWFQNAWFWEHLILETFDPCIGHPNGSGEYHTHVSPSCLYDITDSTQVSPIVGYSFDGYPIYGGYGYSDPMDTLSSIKRLKSSYRLRNISARTTLPDGTVLPASLYGPPIDTNTASLDPLNNTPIAAPLGAYMEDYEYVPGLGDLDEHNGRFCITTEYPNGTYAYFTTIDWVTDRYNTSIKPVFPYVIGPTYYGEVYPTDGNTGPNSGFVVIDEPVTPYVNVVGLEEIEETLNIELFPNPTAGQLNFQLESSHFNTTYVGTIYDKWGKIVEQGDIVPGKMYSYNASVLANGVYYLKITTNDKVYTHKFVVSK
ncbi:MAG: YHYH protein [Fluviicola sp.]|nr:YHYH protein [Fluviicola sp.]